MIEMLTQAANGTGADLQVIELPLNAAYAAGMMVRFVVSVAYLIDMYTTTWLQCSFINSTR